MGRSTKKKDEGQWAKGCIQCGQRYEDRWEPREHIDLCQSCKRGHGKMDSELAQYPRDCCLLNARPVTLKKDRDRMRLGGPPEMVWYICDGDTGACHRTFPFAHPARVPWVWGEGSDPSDEELERERMRRTRVG